MKFFIYLFLLISIIGCKINQHVFKSYPFEIKGFNHQPNPYKFGITIRDSVLPTNGSQYAAWEYSYIGDHFKTLSSWDKDAEEIKPADSSEIIRFESYASENAINYILKRAEKEKILIINEAHHMPQHRIFTTRLLNQLYSKGYRHLGLEAFFNFPKSDSSLMINKYPILTNGIYIKEPQFGNLIRTAIKIGFSVFGYESNDRGKEREIGQANNIQSYMDRFPNEKIIIHCGFSHAKEGNVGGKWEKAMAGRLAEFTGLDPLTVNQTQYSEKSKLKFENKYYQLVDVNGPSVFNSKSGFGWEEEKKESWYDIYVFHPRTKNFDRPNWTLYENRQVKTFTFKNIEIACNPCLVLAYIKGEDIGSAIPYDIQESYNYSANLVLAPGQYDIILLNQQNQSKITSLEFSN